MKFWQSVSWAETDQLCEIARFAEDLGFEGLIGADHALYPRTMRADYPYSESGVPPQTAESEYPDMWTSFAAMAEGKPAPIVARALSSSTVFAQCAL